MGNCLCRASGKESDYVRTVVDITNWQKDVRPDSPVYIDPPAYEPSKAVPVVVQDDEIYPPEKVKSTPAELTKADM